MRISIPTGYLRTYRESQAEGDVSDGIDPSVDVGVANVADVSELGHHARVDHADAEAETRHRHDQVVGLRRERHLQSHHKQHQDGPIAHLIVVQQDFTQKILLCKHFERCISVSSATYQKQQTEYFTFPVLSSVDVIVQSYIAVFSQSLNYPRER